jgi:hypothetical protein
LQRNDYKLVIVYVRSNHLDVDCGLRFSVPVAKKTEKSETHTLQEMHANNKLKEVESYVPVVKKSGTETLTLKEMHANNKLKDVESYVVRANYYTKNSKIIPQRVIAISIVTIIPDTVFSFVTVRKPHSGTYENSRFRFLG